MLFVYIHIIWFASWIGFGVEDYPFGLLTMIVSLDAIFLSTFVMISQNRADAKRQVMEHGPGGGQAERAADQALRADPRADQRSAGAHVRSTVQLVAECRSRR
jgi:hypothetical protein